MTEDRLRDKGCFQLVKSTSTDIGKEEASVLLSQSDKWCDNLREVINKSSVEVGESKKSADIFRIRGVFLAYNSLDFYGIHLNTIGRDYIS